jgi:hypothetical protein
MKIDGGCLCGNITYRADIEPSRVVICHCTDCQTQSGTTFRTIVGISGEKFHLTSGDLKFYERTGDSGARRMLSFCPECGTSIYGAPPEGETGGMSLRVGTIRQRDELAPVIQVWCRSAQPWLSKLGDVPRVDTQPGR